MNYYRFTQKSFRTIKPILKPAGNFLVYLPIHTDDLFQYRQFADMDEEALFNQTANHLAPDLQEWENLYLMGEATSLEGVCILIENLNVELWVTRYIGDFVVIQEQRVFWQYE